MNPWLKNSILVFFVVSYTLFSLLPQALASSPEAHHQEYSKSISFSEISKIAYPQSSQETSIQIVVPYYNKWAQEVFLNIEATQFLCKRTFQEAKKYYQTSFTIRPSLTIRELLYPFHNFW